MLGCCGDGGWIGVHVEDVPVDEVGWVVKVAVVSTDLLKGDGAHRRETGETIGGELALVFVVTLLAGNEIVGIATTPETRPADAADGILEFEESLLFGLGEAAEAGTPWGLNHT
jgi:hypothetical protein